MNSVLVFISLLSLLGSPINVQKRLRPAGALTNSKAPQRFYTLENLGEVEAKLSREPGADHLDITLRNRGREPVAVLRWDALYDLHVYDEKDVELTDLGRYRAKLQERLSSDADWVVLRKNQAVTFPVYAYSADGVMAIPASAVRAMCFNRRTTLVTMEPPAFVRAAKARTAGVRNLFGLTLR